MNEGSLLEHPYVQVQGQREQVWTDQLHGEEAWYVLAARSADGRLKLVPIEFETLWLQPKLEEARAFCAHLCRPGGLLEGFDFVAVGIEAIDSLWRACWFEPLFERRPAVLRPSVLKPMLA